MNGTSLIGHTLDDKYKIERELGRGGMGAVYLATHSGTERPVAVKIIAPEFMRRAEFVERFRREARAAGRLRHPNVVDVTDFGIAATETGDVAYLVMEYLDGCTLGEVLEEEKTLPLNWTLDILEQTSSAIDEAHRQGIIHRDLKPDNIWLEPNQRGGYTVKVLDFGIAKLEEAHSGDGEEVRTVKASPLVSMDSERNGNRKIAVSTASDDDENKTLALPLNADGNAAPSLSDEADDDSNQTLLHNFNGKHRTLAYDANATAVLPEDDSTNSTAILPDFDAAENGTAILPASGDADSTRLLETDRTKILDAHSTKPNTFVDGKETAGLTRVGAVLGTPLYMSPEQCRGERLDPRTDIYSLGVIAYQMLGGKTPFSGTYTEVMRQHKEDLPPPLTVKKIPKKVKNVIAAALSKMPEGRPASASAFTSQLRSYSEGIGALLRRAFVIYGEHFVTFFVLTLICVLPTILLSLLNTAISFLKLSQTITNLQASVLSTVLFFATLFAGTFFGSILVGVTTWVVAQLLAVPLRPVSLRPALEVARQKWRTFAGTVSAASLLSLFGYLFCLLPGVFFSVRYYMVTPVVMMEGLSGRAALRRSTELWKRSRLTVISAYLISFILPMTLAGTIGAATGVIIGLSDINSRARKGYERGYEDAKAGRPMSFSDDAKKSRDAAEENEKAEANKETGVFVDETPTIGTGVKVRIETGDEQEDSEDKWRTAISQAIAQVLWFPFSVLLISLSSVITALLYLKSRQAGGETLSELLAQFEDTDRPRSKWQIRIKERLAGSGSRYLARSKSADKSAATSSARTS